ncbi:alpha-ketoglutarate-dependent dioxygenase AlkB family protein [Shewanella baltica]|uniref:alpha-ketoglutarate-dependent dioxygenase AlkB family protein n=1 Tax=Shewanella baltica TaxID=62322 RepID=UPI00217CDEE5|nr:alpha-ketoglutarate-dependent dioxygenase AlkB [Shewanella baltica]MCS6177220.1 alpha-ketoglutarate-dependent dioxygenase AlkB [Shewanella baltica]MCS6253429.1 alpha-ketoglutarate-dependent dioxygenase AlkB [Shewanella baltica]
MNKQDDAKDNNQRDQSDNQGGGQRGDLFSELELDAAADPDLQLSLSMAEQGSKKAEQPTPPITLVRGYLNAEQQAALMKEAQTYPLSRPEIQVFGQFHAIPRQQVWFGDSGCDYLYSGLFIRALPWPKYAHKLREKLARDYGLASNGVLVNRYADGKDCMGAHSDDEPEIAHGSHIASITLGATRDFVLKHKHSQTKYSISLHSGDLLIMHWPMQNDWLHSLPKRLKVKEPRWNYTFRQLIVNFHG